MPKQHVFISEKALSLRINRKLRWSGRTLKHAQGSGYYLLDLDRDFVVRQYISLEECGPDLGGLRPLEIPSAGANADIRRMRDNGMTLREIGQQVGVSRQRIHQILKAKSDH